MSRSQLPQLFLSESFNATTSLINMGAHPEQCPLAQTVCAVVFPVSAGELGTNTVFSVSGSANNNGARFRFGDAAGWQLSFNGNSTGSAGNPTRIGSDVLAYNEWHFAAGTWDGGITATGIRLFSARNARDLVESGYGTTTDGTTAADNGAGNNLIIGNRGDAGRTFNGQIAYVARWNWVLSPSLLTKVQRQGPLAVPDGLILCYANGRDYGPFNLQPVTKTAVTQRTRPTYFFPIGPTYARRAFVEPPPAGGFFARYYYDMAA